MADEEGRDFPGSAAHRPGAVLEAERTVQRLGRELVGVGTAASALWLLLSIWVRFIPLSWLGAFLAALVVAFFFPPTRRAQQARGILRRWDEAQLGRSIGSSGASADPRMQVAERTGTRIQEHPGATEEMRLVASHLVEALRQATSDQRIIEVMLESYDDVSEEVSPRASLRASLEFIEVRAGRLLGALGDVHNAAMRRDGEEVARVLREADEVLADLDAQAEVNHLLHGREQ